MDLDHGIAVQPARDWYAHRGAWSDDDPAEALARLDILLAIDGQVPLGEPELRMEQRYLGSGPCVYLAEVDALTLRTPNPMPHVRLFGRSRCRG